MYNILLVVVVHYLLLSRHVSWCSIISSVTPCWLPPPYHHQITHPEFPLSRVFLPIYIFLFVVLPLIIFALVWGFTEDPKLAVMGVAGGCCFGLIYGGFIALIHWKISGGNMSWIATLSPLIVIMCCNGCQGLGNNNQQAGGASACVNFMQMISIILIALRMDGTIATPYSYLFIFYYFSLFFLAIAVMIGGYTVYTPFVGWVVEEAVRADGEIRTDELMNVVLTSTGTGAAAA